jgi:hypothetical protein
MPYGYDPILTSFTSITTSSSDWSGAPGEPMMFQAKPARKIVRPVLSSSKGCGLSIMGPAELGRFWKPREDRQDGTAIVGVISRSTAPTAPAAAM